MSDFNREVDRRMTDRKITGEELDLIECLIALRDAEERRQFVNGNGLESRRLLEQALAHITVIEHDNEVREAAIRSELAEKQELFGVAS